MQNLTESLALQTGGFPPPPPSRRADPPNQVNQAPLLPRLAATVPPSPAALAANPFATSMNPTPPRGSQRPGSRAGRRFVSWMIVLGAVGGLVYAGVTYGPELMDRATGEGAIDEPAVAKVFPTAALAPVVVRTATYEVETQRDGGDPVRYTVTSDFESGVSQVTVDRGDLPHLEVLSVFGDSVIRRGAETNWWSLPRGEFPIDASMGRVRWVRTLDEVLPASIRPSLTIERATESSIANEPTTRLLVSVAPSSLAVFAGTSTPEMPASDAATPPAAALLPPGMALVPGTDLTLPIEIELWIDGSDLVRKIVLPAALGGETITVTSVSADAFQPQFPGPDVIQPMTAQALFHLGL